jgi:p-hydroxybenzoate 3-monooxygenase
MSHAGINIAVDGESFRVDFVALTQKMVTVYGQSEVMKDLGEAVDARGLEVIYEASDVRLYDIDSTPAATWTKGRRIHHLSCDFIVGCDGYHGVARSCIPKEELRTFERIYPFGWLGILADVPPCDHELIYANHERGFALATMRSPTRSRYYIQCGLDEKVEDWDDDRFWDEVSLRLGPQASEKITRGKSFEKSIAPLRSFVCEPLRCGRLFLAGDAAHIVPPTGAKGLNLAVSDVICLAEALIDYFQRGGEAQLEAYSSRALARVWKAERFSWWFTMLTHRFPQMDGFDRKMQIAEFDYIRSSRAAQTMLAENYVGLPLGPVRSERATAGVVNMQRGATRPAHSIQASP